MHLLAPQLRVQMGFKAHQRLVLYETFNLRLESLVVAQATARPLSLASQHGQRRALHNPNLTGIGLFVPTYLLKLQVTMS